MRLCVIGALFVAMAVRALAGTSRIAAPVRNDADNNGNNNNNGNNGNRGNKAKNNLIHTSKPAQVKPKVIQDEKGRFVLVDGNRRTVLGDHADNSRDGGDSSEEVEATTTEKPVTMDPRQAQLHQLLAERKITQEQFWNGMRRIRDPSAMRKDVIKDVISGQNKMHVPFINGGREIPLQPVGTNANLLDPDSNTQFGTYGGTNDATSWAKKLFAPIPGHGGYIGDPSKRTGLYFYSDPRQTDRYAPKHTADDNYFLSSLGSFPGRK